MRWMGHCTKQQTTFKALLLQKLITSEGLVLCKHQHDNETKITPNMLSAADESQY
jgi:hypothetical protein